LLSFGIAPSFIKPGDFPGHSRPRDVCCFNSVLLSEVRISEFKISVCFIVQVCNVRYVHLARLVL